MIRNAIRSLFAARSPRGPRKSTARLRPALTTLEGRQLLATFVVDSASDVAVAGQTTLRQAILKANATPGADVITFSTLFDTHQTINLRGDLGVRAGFVTVQGPAAGLTIKGGGGERVMTVGRNARVEINAASR